MRKAIMDLKAANISIADMKVANAELEKRVEDLKVASEKALSILLNKDQEIIKLKDDLATMTTDHQTVRFESITLQRNNSQFQYDFAQCRNENWLFYNENRRLNSKLDALTKLHSFTENECKELKEAVDYLNWSNADLKQMLNTFVYIPEKSEIVMPRTEEEKTVVRALRKKKMENIRKLCRMNLRRTYGDTSRTLNRSNLQFDTDAVKAVESTFIKTNFSTTSGLKVPTITRKGKNAIAVNLSSVETAEITTLANSPVQIISAETVVTLANSPGQIISDETVATSTLANSSVQIISAETVATPTLASSSVQIISAGQIISAETVATSTLANSSVQIISAETGITSNISAMLTAVAETVQQLNPVEENHASQQDATTPVDSITGVTIVSSSPRVTTLKRKSIAVDETNIEKEQSEKKHCSKVNAYSSHTITLSVSNPVKTSSNSTVFPLEVSQIKENSLKISNQATNTAEVLESSDATKQVVTEINPIKQKQAICKNSLSPENFVSICSPENSRKKRILEETDDDVEFNTPTKKPREYENLPSV
ncbi:hypothetical protein HK096_008368 [Nowakowskiella sp. JEL0078]|nr:hypothetical protein HK096_008368 [Nowakowskiella sp. JEL0078]